MKESWLKCDSENGAAASGAMACVYSWTGCGRVAPHDYLGSSLAMTGKYHLSLPRAVVCHSKWLWARECIHERSGVLTFCLIADPPPWNTSVAAVDLLWVILEGMMRGAGSGAIPRTAAINLLVTLLNRKFWTMLSYPQSLIFSFFLKKKKRGKHCITL